MEYKFRKFERFDLMASSELATVTMYLKEHLNVMVDDLNTGLSSSDPQGLFYNEKAQGAAGDSSASNTWNTRVIERSSGAFTVESNQITLPRGSYSIDGWGISTGAVVSHQLRLYNVTNDATLVLGGSIGSGACSIIKDDFTVNSDIKVEIQHFTQAAGAFGVAITGSNKVEKEIYLQTRITKKG